MGKISCAVRVKTKRQGEQVGPTYYKMKKGQMDWTHLVQQMPTKTR
jgi:hypothetical protein